MEPVVVTQFTPLSSFLGGVLIGLSALAVLFLFGRVTGISGITSTGLFSNASDKVWRLAFLIGLISAPLLWGLFGLGQHLVNTSVIPTISSNVMGMIIAGLCVGFGTVLGSGCTSGHGVCGLGRLSMRSLIAVMVFMASAFATVLVLRHIL